MYNFYFIGLIVTLFIYYVLSYVYVYSEIKAYWWMLIFGISILSITYQKNIKNISKIIIGSLIVDTIISVLYLISTNEILESLFIFIHHTIWMSLLYLNIEYAGSNAVYCVLMGQIFIASVDLFSNLIKTFGNIRDKLDYQTYNDFLQILNIIGRLAIGNYFIWLVYKDSFLYKNMYILSGIVNTVIGITLLINNDILNFY